MKAGILSIIAVSIICILSCTKKTAISTENKKIEQPMISGPIDMSKDYSMYPEVQEGMKRYIIRLAQKKNEFNYSVEVFVGKNEEVDCNNYSLSGQLEEKVIHGWGYSYLEFPNSYQMIGTRKGCPDNSKRTLFVRSQSVKKYYNSRSPIIIYVPDDLEVKYAIWSKGETELNAEELK